DADTIYEEDALKNLVRNFSDPKVGGVCGKLVLIKEGAASCNEESIYWDYENRIKELESSLRTITGINGQAFAIGRELFEELPRDSITEDQVLGMRIIERGYDILFEPKAICREKAHPLKEEFMRRIRISAGNFQSISFSAKVLDPRTGFASFAFWSHKILRWFAPFFLIALFISNMYLLDILFFRFTFFTQVLFYLISFFHYGLSVIGYDFKILRVIFYFNMMNLAVLIGFFRFITGTQKVTWEKA
ncbi:MAG: glycosyltransferase, partial [Candidatus Omnitrophica bacterium]|nr:glycosyltransferase [Candidatus Omnitrophota bacterium]